MVLERYRGGWQKAMTPFARVALDAGLSPNAVTVASLVFAVAAGLCFWQASPAAPWLLVVGAVFAALNAIADAVDGRMARMGNQESKKGDYLDHVVDRYSDLALILGLAFSPYGDLRIGVAALVGTFMTSYLGTQSQALGLGRNYAGFLGRADRVVLILAVPFIEGMLTLLGFARPLPFTLVTALLVYLAVVGNLTAIQRFAAGWKELDKA